MTTLHTEHPSASKTLLQLFDNAHCVGTATVVRGYLDDITVYAPYRHHGYGQALLHACEDCGATQAIVVSDEGRHLFSAAGWRHCGGPRFERVTH